MAGHDGQPGQVERAAQKYGSENVWATSYTRAGARVLSSRHMPLPRQSIGTLHSFCHRALGRPTIAETKLAAWNEARPDLRLSSAVGVDEDDMEQLKPADEAGADKIYSRMKLFRARCAVDEMDVEARSFFAAWEDWKRKEGLVDFQDLIDHCAAAEKLPSFLPRVLVVDEAQDHSLAEMRLLRRWGSAAEMLLLVGDPDQAIYEWKGATPRAFLEGEHEKPIVLKQSWRVPRAVLRKALRWIEEETKGERFPVTYLPRDADGEVRVGDPGCSWMHPDEAIRDARIRAEADETTMLLTTCHYQLRGVVRRLRDEGLPFWNPYRPKAGDWNPLRTTARGTSSAKRLLAFLRPDTLVWGRESSPWTAQGLVDWMTPISKKVLKKHVLAALKSVASRDPDRRYDVATARDLFRDPADYEAASRLSLDWYDNQLLSEPSRRMAYPLRVARLHGGAELRGRPRIVVGTIHSVKGGQCDNVHVFPDLSPQASIHKETRDGWDAMVRLFYVAMTRARVRLTLHADAMGDAADWGVV